MASLPFYRQIPDNDSGTFAYLLADGATGQALLIDAVLGDVPLYGRLLRENGLKLAWLIETHLHDDHVSGAWVLRTAEGADTVAGPDSGIEGADRYLEDGEVLRFGDETIRALATPGHTPGCTSLLWRDRVFTGDALHIGGCGHADPPLGNAGRLFDSLAHRLLTLPDDTIVCPGHARDRRRISCIGEERLNNPCIAGRSRDEFVAGLRPGPAAGAEIRALHLAINALGGDPEGIPDPPTVPDDGFALH